ncbi:MAG: vWA domain-containing protein [Schaedlerella sp.]|nr:vWA domain-containing protein [Schaedlerella sp.]
MQKKSRIKRFLCFLITLVILLGFIPNSAVAQAAEVTKEEKTYDIAVVFDNSGSMYNDSKAWCRAKYAMEIFASMMNYENGDKLVIFPMWEVTTDGSTSGKKGSFEAIEINSKEDIDKISNLYTVNPSNTPFEPIKEAYEYLKKSNAEEKWLVILTDGTFNEDVRGQAAAIDVRGKLLEMASEDIKVQYLGFGGAAPLAEDAWNFFYSMQSKDAELKDDLISVCNTIFQRSALPVDRLNGSELTLDLSMKNLIVFAQGSNAKINSLKNDSGEEIKITLDSGQRKFSEIKARGKESAPVDNTLAGQVVTFGSCPAGTYTLDYSGTDKIQIFYEPDVDISITLTNSDGEVVDISKDEVNAGEYTLNYSIVDNVTGEDVTNSELLGDDMSLTGTVVNSAGEETPVENGGTVTLEPDEATYFKVEGTYLKKYKISTEDNAEGYTIKVNYPDSDELKVKAKVTQPKNWYKIKDHDTWEPVRVDVELNGEPLTDEQMGLIRWKIEPSGDIEYRYELLPGESACNIYIGQNENGEYVEPETGSHTLKVEAMLLDEFERENSGKDTARFDIQTYSAIWRWLIYVVELGIILALLMFYMSRKVLPKGIILDRMEFTVLGRPMDNGGEISYSRKGRSLSIDSIPVPHKMAAECHVVFSLVPVDRRWTPSRSRRIGIVAVDAMGMGVTGIKVDGVMFEKKMPDAIWVVRGSEEEAINEKVKNADIVVETKFSTLRCSLMHR